MSANPVYDLAVIGAGIAGASIAREAQIQNLSVVLFEKNTFASGTSSKSSKLIHGGLRYLETAWSALLKLRLPEFWKNLRFVFLALRETHILAKTWPGLIKEIELLLPIYKNAGRSRWEIFCGSWLYGFLSSLSGGRFTHILGSPAKALEVEPGLNPEGLLGAVMVYDHTTDDAALVKRLIEDAGRRGAEAHEHAEVIRYHFGIDRYKLTVRAANGQEKTFFAKKLVNATGAWADQVRRQAGGITGTMIEPVAGAHIEVPVFTRHSVILQAKDNRIFFVINRGDRARIGTTERHHDNPDHVDATLEEIDYLLRSVKLFFPGTALSQKSILATDAGIRPLVKPKRATSAHDISRDHEFVWDKDGAVHVIGVKLTDHRRAAVELLKKLNVAGR